MRSYILTISILFLSLSFPTEALSQRIGYKFKTERNTKAVKDKNSGQSASSKAKDTAETNDDGMTAGSFMVASQCPTCNNGYTLKQIVFSGFDKNQNNSMESFFIKNNTDRTLTGINLYIDYRTLDGRQLNKLFVRLSCDIPAGETRKVDIKSWDTQHSFYYFKSNPSKRKGNAFDVQFDLIAYYLQF